MFSIFRVCCLVAVCGLMWLPVTALAQSKEAKEKVCKELFQQKRFLEAARCFAALADSLDAAALKDASSRYQKGRWLRNAAILMTRAARAESDIAKKSYYFEQARAYVVPYLQEKLYETKHQQRLAKVRLTGLEAKIGYASLSVTTKHLKAQIQLEGYKFKAGGVGAWSQKVRPGSYVIRVTYPGAPVEIKAIKIAAGQPQVVAFVPPAAAVARRTPPARRAGNAARAIARKATTRALPPQGKKPAWPWILVAGGGAVAVAGVVFLGLGGGNYGAANAMRERGIAGNLQPDDKASTYNELHAQVGWQLPLGGILAGVGGAALVAGLVAYASAKATPASASSALPSHRDRTLATFK